MAETAQAYEVSTDAARLDRDLIFGFLRTSYWAHNIPRQVVERAIDHSLCFGAYTGNVQAGFARVITDRATFAYLADVFVVPEHRGRGVSKLLMQTILAHPDLQGLRRFLLATQDAHGLYTRFGFKPLTSPEHYLTIHNPDVYQNGGDRAGGAGQAGVLHEPAPSKRTPNL
jgi:GNAT superfamily N-acetyltransferase